MSLMSHPLFTQKCGISQLQVMESTNQYVSDELRSLSRRGGATARATVAADTADTAKAWGFAAEQWGRFVSQMWKSHCHLVFLLEIDFESQWNCPKINQNDICFAS